MDDGNTKIYGLEFQARALASQQGEGDVIRFLIGTQVLKQANNQVHLVEVAEDTEQLITRVYQHNLGEIWKLTCSPHDPATLCTCYSTFKGSNLQWTMQSSLLRLPESEGDIPDEHEKLQVLATLDTEQHGTDIRTTEFSPSDATKVACVIDSSVLIMDIGEAASKVTSVLTDYDTVGIVGAAKVQIPGKGSKLTNGKWSMHHQGNQFITLYDMTIKSWDIRDSNQSVWSIENAHSQLIRDLDSNPNKQFHIASCGDDGSLKVWDYRNVKEPVFVRNDHSHWVWSVRYNTFHDQLLLTSGSDSRVHLTCAVSVSSEAESDTVVDGDSTKEKLQDGLLHTWDAYEDSVYCSEWSSVDPWIFASLSYDGRLAVCKVPRQRKYRILL